MPNTNKPTKDQANKIKHFINLAFEYNKTHNLKNNLHAIKTS